MIGYLLAGRAAPSMEEASRDILRKAVKQEGESSRKDLSTEISALFAKSSHGVAVFDAGAAEKAADLMALWHKQARPDDLRDTMIAGIALAHRAAQANRNTRHFADLPVRAINPWIALSARWLRILTARILRTQPLRIVILF